MTLISSPAPLTPSYPYPCFHTQSTEDTYSLNNASGLSWLQPATASAPASASASQKYRTLASIQSQTRQQHLYRLNNDTCPAAPLSPSIKPNPLDSLPFEYSSHNHSHHTHPQTVTPVITSAIQDMDKSHGTCFLTWIHNPANLDYISLRLRPLCLEYPLVDVANVLRWIGADWSSADCKALFRAVTQSWDQGKRRILAFLLIRDEDMRQKAKSKLVEFAQRTRTKTQSIRRSHLQQQQQQQPPQQEERPQPRHHHQNHRQLHHLQSTTTAPTPLAPPKHSQEPSVPQFVDSVWQNKVSTKAEAPLSELTTLQDLVAAAIITGLDFDMTLSMMSIPTQSTSPSSDPVVCASKTNFDATPSTIRQHRFSPY